jgi:hypothetical protein
MFWAYKKKKKNIGTTVFLLVFLKLLLSGPEYVFSALLLPFLPLVFYAVLNRIPIRKVMEDILLITTGVVSACFIAFSILMVQVSAVSSPMVAMRFFIEKTVERIFITDLILREGYHASIKVVPLELLHKYLLFPCISIGFFNVSFRAMILFFCIISILAFYLYRCYHQRALLALLITTWFSVLCPLSWIFIAKGHSAFETHDKLVWHMPFTLLGMALTLATLRTWIFKQRV